jgi:hypothetical protein
MNELFNSMFILVLVSIHLCSVCYSVRICPSFSSCDFSLEMQKIIVFSFVFIMTQVIEIYYYVRLNKIINPR